MSGKERFIRMMAASETGKRLCDVTEAQYKTAKELFLAMAYDGLPEYIERLKSKLRGQ